MGTAKLLLTIVLGIPGFLILYRIAINLVRKVVHFPVPAFVGAFLDSDLRRALQPPGPLVERSGIREGMTVLEVGCGSGAYTTFVARAVGTEGRVCALDIQAAMLRRLRQKLSRPEHQDIQNVELYEKSAYDLPFDDGIFDVVYMITVLQEIPDPRRALAEAKRVLKAGGKLAVSEFLPDPDYPLRSTTVSIGQAAGFTVDAVLGNYWTYTVRFSRPSRRL
jgi:ubiquinone/menaquinone biosynthesis C-methylase UbiE